MKKSIRRSMVIFLMVSLLVLAGGYYVLKSIFHHILNASTASLEQNRPAVAEEIPNLSNGDIIDIRITAVPRQFTPPTWLFNEKVGTSYLQIYYGFYQDDIWYDYPSENFELSGIFSASGKQGWKVAMSDHIVELGPYILVCINRTGASEMICEISDTIDSQILDPFSEYASENFGYLCENVDTEGCRFTNSFWQRYYLLLEYESLPDDYVLTYTEKTSSYTNTYSLTKDEIKNLID